MPRSTLILPTRTSAAAYRAQLRRDRIDRPLRAVLLRIDAAVLVVAVVASTALVIGFGYAIFIAACRLAVAIADVIGTI